jgi:hypothetical protein
VVATFYRTGGPSGNYNPQDFFAYLEATYGDPNQARKAATKLRTLKQDERQTFASFLPTFEQTLAEAGGSTWEDAAKLTLLDSAISEGLRRALVSVDLPEQYNLWVQQVMKVSYKLEALSPRTGKKEMPAPNLLTNPAQIDAEGDVKMSGVNTTSMQKAASTTTRETRRARWVSAREIQQRRDEKRCFRCGGDNHRVSQCPYRPAIPPTNQTTTRSTPATTTTVSPELEEEEDSEPGKE